MFKEWDPEDEDIKKVVADYSHRDKCGSPENATSVPPTTRSTSDKDPQQLIFKIHCSICIKVTPSTGFISPITKCGRDGSQVDHFWPTEVDIGSSTP